MSVFDVCRKKSSLCRWMRGQFQRSRPFDLIGAYDVVEHVSRYRGPFVGRFCQAAA
jgi:hypothetical protein